MGSNNIIKFDITSESDCESEEVWDVESVYDDMVGGCLIKCIRCRCKHDASHYGVNDMSGNRMKNCNACITYMANYRAKHKTKK